MAYMKSALKRYGVRRRRGMSGLGDEVVLSTSSGAGSGTSTSDWLAQGAPSGETTGAISITGSGASVPPQQQASGSSWFDSLMKGFANVTTPPQQPMPVMAQAPGLSTTTLVIGGVALVGLALFMKSRK